MTSPFSSLNCTTPPVSNWLGMGKRYLKLIVLSMFLLAALFTLTIIFLIVALFNLVIKSGNPQPTAQPKLDAPIVQQTPMPYLEERLRSEEARSQALQLQVDELKKAMEQVKPVPGKK